VSIPRVQWLTKNNSIHTRSHTRPSQNVLPPFHDPRWRSSCPRPVWRSKHSIRRRRANWLVVIRRTEDSDSWKCAAWHNVVWWTDSEWRSDPVEPCSVWRKTSHNLCFACSRPIRWCDRGQTPWKFYPYLGIVWWKQRHIGWRGQRRNSRSSTIWSLWRWSSGKATAIW
jgi:hypothetical protein